MLPVMRCVARVQVVYIGYGHLWRCLLPFTSDLHA